MSVSKLCISIYCLPLAVADQQQQLGPCACWEETGAGADARWGGRGGGIEE